MTRKPLTAALCLLLTISAIAAAAQQEARTSIRRWTEDKARAWAGAQPWTLGCNYIPRTAGSRFEDILPLFKSEDVGAMNWGFVSGKTQTIFPWGSKEGSPEPAVWFHDIFRANGTPYIAAEVELIRKLAGKARPADNEKTRAVTEPFHAWALTPPLGWNSWDSFGQAVTEDEVKANADFMAAKLAKLGWRYVVVDIEWSEPQRLGPDYPVHSKSEVDAFGRFVPAEARFPSAAGGRGFKPLADYVHRQGLKFGVHIVRGIPRLAVERNTPIEGAPYKAADIADKVDFCDWNEDQWGVDVKKPGAQDRSGTIPSSASSLPGASISSRPTTSATGARRSPCCAGPGHWLDPDMLPLGHLRFLPAGWSKNRTMNAGYFEMTSHGGREDVPNFLSRDEQRTVMTLWAIAKCPLMFGGHLPASDDWTLSLITNAEVLTVNQSSRNNRQLFRANGLAAWTADDVEGKAKYVAVFNTSNRGEQGPEAGTAVPVRLSELGFDGPVVVWDVWSGREIGVFTGEFAPVVPYHGAGLYRLTADQDGVKPTFYQNVIKGRFDPI